MSGIDMNRPIFYGNASLRFFDPGECHITRYCNSDVLLLVYEGVLRFSEDGVEYEVGEGRYFIQRQGSDQVGAIPSDAPKYLYVHFLADWTESGAMLPRSGEYDYASLRPLIEELDRMSHGDATMTEQMTVFYDILSRLYRHQAKSTVADRIAAFISENLYGELTLERLAEEFHFSKNHVINLFRENYGVTPFEYMNRQRVRRAEWLLEVTSRPAGSIAEECGFRDYSHFYKTFRRINGLSPVEWRRYKRVSPSSVYPDATVPVPALSPPSGRR